MTRFAPQGERQVNNNLRRESVVRGRVHLDGDDARARAAAGEMHHGEVARGEQGGAAQLVVSRLAGGDADLMEDLGDHRPVGAQHSGVAAQKPLVEAII